MYKNMADYYEYIFPVGDKGEFLSKNFKGANTLLDIGCADGRVAKTLADKGFKVKAVDLSEDMVEVAKEVSKSNENLSVDLMDMTKLDQHFKKNSFDGIYCIGNTFVHLKSYELIEKTLKMIKSLLKKDGKLIIQILNYDFIYKNNKTELPLIENEKIKFKRSYELGRDNLVFKTTLLIKDTREEFKESSNLYPIRKSELEKALKEAGFDNLTYYGGFDESSFTKDSMPLIVIAKQVN